MRLRCPLCGHGHDDWLCDLFCGAGGAAMGYHRAGFGIVGVDKARQPHYPFTFVQGDALHPPVRLEDFDVIHASPPCQAFIRGGLQDRSRTLDLLTPTRQMLSEFGARWVIENVPGAPMRADVKLCGSAFGLAVRRHRWFEFSDPPTVMVPPCDHSQPVVGVYGHPHGEAGAWPGMLAGSLASWREALGADWMDAGELSQAIPPAYTRFIGARFIGEQLLEHLAVKA